MPLQFPEFKTVNLAEIGHAADRDQANQMALRLQQMQLNKAQRDEAADAEIRNVFRNSGGDLAGALPKVMAVDPTRGLALGKTIQEQQKAALEQKKLTGDIGKTEFETNKKKADMLASLSNAIVAEYDQHQDPAKANQQWQTMLQVAGQQYGMDVAKMPQQFDPQTARLIAKSSLDVAKQMEQALKERELTNPIAVNGPNGPTMMQAPKHAQPAGSGIQPIALAGATPYAKPDEFERLTAGLPPAQRAAIEAERIKKLTTHQPASQTIVNTGEKSFLTQLGGKVGDRVVSQADEAESAISTLRNVKQIKDAMASGQIILGPGADTRQSLLRLGSALGVTGGSQDEMLANTRNVMQGLARQELAAAGQMKGQGQITENERAILRKAESGEIGQLSMPELKTLTQALEKTSNFRIQRHEKNMSQLRSNPNAAAVAPFLETPTPPSTAPERTVIQEASKPIATTKAPPDPAKFVGKYMQSPDGSWWQSDGKSWKKAQ